MLQILVLKGTYFAITKLFYSNKLLKISISVKVFFKQSTLSVYYRVLVVYTQLLKF